MLLTLKWKMQFDQCISLEISEFIVYSFLDVALRGPNYDMQESNDRKRSRCLSEEDLRSFLRDRRKDEGLAVTIRGSAERRTQEESVGHPVFFSCTNVVYNC